MSIDRAIRRSFQKKYDNGWEEFPRMFWAIDLHGVILKSTYREAFGEQDLNKDCIDVLRWLSNHSNMSIILFTASNQSYIDEVMTFFKKLGIRFDHVNTNPEIQTKGFCNVDKKFYFDILIDDKAGFEIDSDWSLVKDTLIDLEEWEKVNEEKMISICAWCRKVTTEGLTEKDIGKPGYGITHGICEKCAETAFAEIEKL